MNYQEFVDKVKKYAGLDSNDDARVITEASLGTLGETLRDEHRKHLAAQLPNELKLYVTEYPKWDKLTLEQYYIRVGNRAGLRMHEATKRSRAVMRVLQEAVAPGEVDHMLDQLPAGYNELLKNVDPGLISPSTPDTHELYKEL